MYDVTASKHLACQLPPEEGVRETLRLRIINAIADNCLNPDIIDWEYRDGYSFENCETVVRLDCRMHWVSPSAA